MLRAVVWSTALHLASLMDDLQIIQLLCGYGADIGATDRLLKPPLDKVISECEGENSAVIQYLCDNGARTKSFAAHKWALWYGKTDAFKTLLLAGADVVPIQYPQNRCEPWEPRITIMVLAAGRNMYEWMA
jgi:hypothetical protein